MTTMWVYTSPVVADLCTGKWCLCKLFVAKDNKQTSSLLSWPSVGEAGSQIYVTAGAAAQTFCGSMARDAVVNTLWPLRTQIRLMVCHTHMCFQ